MYTDIETINKRKDVLEKSRVELKKHFVCLDETIDKIIDTISLWYINSSLLERAPIICLWGPTGVGKTDLIKRLMRMLSLDNQFFHMSMNSLSKGSQTDTVTSSFQKFILHNSEYDKDNNVIMLDEFQWFNSKTEQGISNKADLFGDIWDFLSEREIKKEIVINMVDRIFDTIDNYKIYPSLAYYGSYAGNDDFNKEIKRNKVQNKIVGQLFSINEIKNLQKLYLPNDTVKDILVWPIAKFVDVIDGKRQNQDVFQNISCRHNLIIISGNLDGAYPFCSDITGYDMDADYFHGLSKKVNIINIKKTLQESFKDEHIARLGNNHVIFPTINHKGYKVIIKRYCEMLSNRIVSEQGVKVLFGDNVVQMIYNNSVYPTQGARPIFTTINDFFNHVISKYLLNAIVNNKKEICVDYNFDNMSAFVEGNCEDMLKYIGDIDKIKMDENKKMNEKTLNAVHEAGHAIVYSLLYNIVPNKITVNTSTSYGGFITDDIEKTSFIQHVIDVSVLFAGIEAEKLVFGENYVSTGASSDIRKATRILSFLVRHSGIINDCTISNEQDEESKDTDNNNASTNFTIEKLAAKYKKQAGDLLRKNSHILIDLADALFKRNSMDAEEVKDFFLIKHGLSFGVKGYESTSDLELNMCGKNSYVNLFQEFKKQDVKG